MEMKADRNMRSSCCGNCEITTQVRASLDEVKRREGRVRRSILSGLQKRESQAPRGAGTLRSSMPAEKTIR